MSSTVSRTRVRGLRNSIPYHRSIMVWLEEPTPRTTRSGAMCERATADAASTAGGRLKTGTMPRPIRTRPVRAPMAAAAVRASIRPLPSVIQMLSNPSASAWTALSMGFQSPG